MSISKLTHLDNVGKGANGLKRRTAGGDASQGAESIGQEGLSSLDEALDSLDISGDTDGTTIATGNSPV